MLRSLSIKNYKSILDLKLELGRINVFIGENGCGKSNILEAVAMLAAAATDKLELDELYGRGIRIAKPSITISSFAGGKLLGAMMLGAKFDDPPWVNLQYKVYPADRDDIFTEWKSERTDGVVLSEDVERYEGVYIPLSAPLDELASIIAKIERDIPLKSMVRASRVIRNLEAVGSVKNEDKYFSFVLNQELYVDDVFGGYLNYSLSTQSLRGITAESKKIPLGIGGENLDVLIASFAQREREKLMEYAELVSWVADVLVDPDDKYKLQGHKLGRSTSTLYFKDRFMRQRNNIFSAENANEGILHVLFYGALFISQRTPKLFGIDNIETSLNPHLCRNLMKELCKLAKENDKQALITTHNPAILDGLNLKDDEQRLFVVSRSDKGDTRAKRIQLKENVEVDGQKLKLSELWMRGHLGGLPTNF